MLIIIKGSQISAVHRKMHGIRWTAKSKSINFFSLSITLCNLLHSASSVQLSVRNYNYKWNFVRIKIISSQHSWSTVENNVDDLVVLNITWFESDAPGHSVFPSDIFLEDDRHLADESLCSPRWCNGNRANSMAVAVEKKQTFTIYSYTFIAITPVYIYLPLATAGHIMPRCCDVHRKVNKIMDDIQHPGVSKLLTCCHS